MEKKYNLFECPNCGESVELKRCSACKKRKPYDEFYKNRDNADGHDHLCIPCRKMSRK